MISQHTYAITYEQTGQLIRDQVTQWRILGVLPIYTRRQEIWRKATAVSDELRLQVYEADQWQCVYCGSARLDSLAIDHRTPQLQGGVTIFQNLLTACKSCNSAKGGRTPEEANMPLLYGRFQHRATGEQATSASVSPEARRAVELFMQGFDPAAIVLQLRNVRSSEGRRYQVALAEVLDLIRQGMAQKGGAR